MTAVNFPVRAMSSNGDDAAAMLAGAVKRYGSGESTVVALDGVTIAFPAGRMLVERAKADGRSLVGPGGLLADLTKQVLETGLEVEMDEQRRLREARSRGPQRWRQSERDAVEDGDHRGWPGRARRVA